MRKRTTTLAAPAEKDMTAEQLAAALERIRVLELRVDRLEQTLQSSINVTLPPLPE